MDFTLTVSYLKHVLYILAFCSLEVQFKSLCVQLRSAGEGTFLVVQWLVRTWCFHCHGPGSIPGRGTKTLQGARCSIKRKKEKKGREEGKKEK